MILITGSENIQRIHLLALKGALKLETLGMTRHGRSAYSIVKDEMGFKGNKQKVLEQLETYIQSH